MQELLLAVKFSHFVLTVAAAEAATGLALNVPQILQVGGSCCGVSAQSAEELLRGMSCSGAMHDVVKLPLFAHQHSMSHGIGCG